LVEDQRVIAKAQASVGARNTARDGSNKKLKATLRQLIAEVRDKARTRDEKFSSPHCVVGTGMLTSPLGLLEVPHVQAPAGVDKLVSGIRHCYFPEIIDLPILLIPGVRTGPIDCELALVNSCDVMRGEESLCLGAHAAGWLAGDGVLLNLGSHWKIIVWRRNEIVASLSLLSGEMIFAAQTQTVLADAVPSTRVSEIDSEWCEAGINEQQQSGLMRTLFCVRLLQLAGKSGPLQRMSFLLGAFIGDALDAWTKSKYPPDSPQHIVISGGVLAEAWSHALAKHAHTSARALTNEQVEDALLQGLNLLADRSQLNPLTND
jgi:2-dehydro-3-deoxygalactonokinase